MIEGDFIIIIIIINALMEIWTALYKCKCVKKALYPLGIMSYFFPFWGENNVFCPKSIIKPNTECFAHILNSTLMILISSMD